MLNNKKRGLLASAGALVTAVALAFGGAAAAQAAPVDAMPESSALVITKLEQSKGDGAVASGLKQTGLAGTAIAGVTFEAYQVPLVNDAMSNDGQQEIADITLADAKALVGEKAANRLGTPMLRARSTGTTRRAAATSPQACGSSVRPAPPRASSQRATSS